MIGSAQIATADPIAWSGASTSVGLFGQTQSSTGVDSRASLSGTTTIPYYSITYQEHGVTQGQGSASAQINGTPDNLFNLSTSFLSSTLPGSTFLPSPRDESSASWAGDRVLIGSSPGQPEPGMVRLNFSISFPQLGSPSWNGTNPGTLSGDINGQQWSYSVDGNKSINFNGSQPFDSESITLDRTTGVSYLGQLTFHIDLPLNSSGVSDPFQVGLSDSAWTRAGYSGTFLTGLPDVTLSLDSVTLADGNTPESEGYSVAFASGLASPNAVPEPATFAIFAAGIGALAARRNRRITGA